MSRSTPPWVKPARPSARSPRWRTTASKPRRSPKASTTGARWSTRGRVSGEKVASADDTHVITVTGDIVRYEPNHMIVLKNTEGREMTYTLGPSVVVPSGVAVGRHVTLYTSGEGEKSVVTRVSTEVMPNGDVQR